MSNPSSPFAVVVSMSTAALFLLAFLLVSNDSVESRVYRVKSNINLTKPKPSPAPSNRTCRVGGFNKCTKIKTIFQFPGPFQPTVARHHVRPSICFALHSKICRDRVCELCHEMFSYMVATFTSIFSISFPPIPDAQFPRGMLRTLLQKQQIQKLPQYVFRAATRSPRRHGIHQILDDEDGCGRGGSRPADSTSLKQQTTNQKQWL